MGRGETSSWSLAICFVPPAGADAPTLHRFQGWLDEARSRQLRPDPSEREERGDLVLILTAEVNRLAPPVFPRYGIGGCY